jgi:acyl-CoA reductase-like NAD-dependent aldehyde dehydrogenase
VGVAVSAFNHPLNLSMRQVAPAIAAGCLVIVKPATETPLSWLCFVAILHEAGLPPGWWQALVIYIFHEMQIEKMFVGPMT